MALGWSRIFRRRAFGPAPDAIRLSCFDLDWELAARDVTSLSLDAAPHVVRGPFCPACGRRVERRDAAWHGVAWRKVENPCKKCGRRANHPELFQTVPALRRGVLVEAQRRRREGGPASDQSPPR